MTSPSSWKVVCYFMRGEEASMNQASVQTGVSYPWARAVVKKLLEIGAAKEHGRKVGLEDVDKLFEYVAWERPVNSLRPWSSRAPTRMRQRHCTNCTETSRASSLKSACALFTAADLYLEGMASGGCIQLYADENAALVTKSLMGRATA